MHSFKVKNSKKTNNSESLIQIKHINYLTVVFFWQVLGVFLIPFSESKTNFLYKLCETLQVPGKLIWRLHTYNAPFDLILNSSYSWMAFTTTKTGWTEVNMYTRYTIYVRTFRLATLIQKLPVRRVDTTHFDNVTT